MNIALKLLPVPALIEVLEKFTFNHDGGNEVANDDWTVRPSIWPSQKPGCFDAGVCINYRGRGTPPLDGILIKAFTSASSAEKLSVVAEPIAATTNRAGQAWFHDLPFGIYTARVVARVGQNAISESPVISVPAAATTRASKNRGHSELIAAKTEAKSSTFHDVLLIAAERPVSLGEIFTLPPAGLGQQALFHVRGRTVVFTIPEGLTVIYDNARYTSGKEFDIDRAELGSAEVQLAMETPVTAVLTITRKS